MGFPFKVAPGVGIRATSREVRASVRPRAARVHFGAGGTGFSTGAGPVSLYYKPEIITVLQDDKNNPKIMVVACAKYDEGR